MTGALGSVHQLHQLYAQYDGVVFAYNHEAIMKGSCLCKSTTYEVDSLAGPIGHCHCRTCQKAHAAVFASTARVNRSAFRWTSNTDKLGSFESTPGKLRHFCTQCGSHLMAEWLNRDNVILRVATLDDDPQSKPSLHIWTSHDVPWLDIGDDLPTHQEAP